MKSLKIISLLCLGIWISNAFAVNGISVVEWNGNVKWKKHAGGITGTELRNYPITNSKVGMHKTIYTGNCRWPVISIDGKKVAFYRYDESSGGAGYVSIVNIDGGTVTDLATVANSSSMIGSISWPQGKYIYYANGDNDEVWKVDPDNKSDNKKIAKVYATLRTWRVNYDGTRFAGQLKDGTGGGDHKCAFPSELTLLKEGAYLAKFGCNTTMAPSGGFLAGFFDAGHQTVSIKDWEHENSTGFHNVQDMQPLCSDPIGNGMDLPRWSCNSDRWQCLHVNMGGRFDSDVEGGNQILLNWIDKECINTTKHPKGSGKQTGAGDFWVSGLKDNLDLVHRNIAFNLSTSIKELQRLRSMKNYTSAVAGSKGYYNINGRFVNQAAPAAKGSARVLIDANTKRRILTQ